MQRVPTTNVRAAKGQVSLDLAAMGEERPYLNNASFDGGDIVLQLDSFDSLLPGFSV